MYYLISSFGLQKSHDLNLKKKKKKKKRILKTRVEGGPKKNNLGLGWTLLLQLQYFNLLLLFFIIEIVYLKSMETN